MMHVPSKEEAPRKRSLPRLLGWMAWMLLAHLIAGVVLILALVRMVPEFVRLLEDFDAPVPALTEVVIGLSQVVAQYWYLLVPLVFVVDAAVLLGLRLLPGKAKGLSTSWAVLVLVVAIVLLGLVILAVAMPLEALIEGAS